MDLQAQKYDECLKKILAEDKKPDGYYELLRKAEYHYSRYDGLHRQADYLLAGTGGVYESIQDDKREIEEMKVKAKKLRKRAGAAFDKYLALRKQAYAMLGNRQSVEPV